MRVPEDWWKDYFNDIYLLTDARSVCNHALTRKEVSLLVKLLNLDKQDRILDLCGGQGRHSLELAKRGYKDLTVLDFSKYLLRLGKTKAEAQDSNIRFLCMDARSTGLKDSDYSVIFIMANSFGYFQDEEENLLLLRESHRLLKEGGKLLLDLTDSDYAKKNLKPLSRHRANKEISVLRQRRLAGNIIKAKETVISEKKGVIREGLYCERLYSKYKILNLLKKAGFGKISIKNNLSLHNNKRDYGLMTSRMFVTAIKP